MVVSVTRHAVKIGSPVMPGNRLTKKFHPLLIVSLMKQSKRVIFYFACFFISNVIYLR